MTPTRPTTAIRVEPVLSPSSSRSATSAACTPGPPPSFVTLAERFGASVDVLKDGQVVSARSIMGLMMLGAGAGADIELRAEGWDAKEALDALAALVEAGFDEQD